jgi:uncharacterized protein YutE (UPF0331/DUF86 family)
MKIDTEKIQQYLYWFISDEKLLGLVRENKTDFISFIEAIENYIKNRSP